MGSQTQAPDSCSLASRNLVLRSALKLNHFNVIQINPGSLKSHLNEVRELIEKVNVDAISVSETWFSDSHNDKLISIPGFSVIRNDRNNRRGGGVAIYLRNFYKYRIIYKSPTNARIEALLIEVLIGNAKILLGVVYNPPPNLIFDTFQRNFLDISSKYDHAILAGDFNVDLTQQNSASKKFRKFLDDCQLQTKAELPSNFVYNCRPSLIDFIFVKQLNLLKTYSQIELGSFTSHDLIFASYNLDTSSVAKTNFIKYRSLKNINISQLHKEASKCNFSQIYTTPHIDKMVSILNKNINFLLNKFAPIRKQVISQKSTNAPWMSQDLKKLIDCRNFHHTASKSTHSNRKERESHISEAKRLNKEVTKMKNFLKTKSTAKLFDRRVHPQKRWQNFRTFGVIKNKKSKVDIDFSAEDINKFFSNSFKKSNNSSTPTNNRHPVAKEFLFSTIVDSETSDFILSISSNAIGVDGIPINFIKMILPFVTPHLTYICNNCITKSYYPKAWKTANVIPIPKVKTPKELDDLRPISILPCISKVLEKALHKQMTEFIENNNLLYKFQSGFRKGHSTTSALLRIYHEIYEESDHGLASFVTLLDFRKAFDTVPHSLLIDKLISKFNFSLSAANLVKSYLSDRWQRVKLDDEISNLSRVTSGTPQGGILSALLFAIFINDLPDAVHDKFPDIDIHLYADDTQFRFSFRPDEIDSAIFTADEIMSTVTNWCYHNEVVLNPSKSKAMIIHRRELKTSRKIFVDGKEIEICSVVRNLGLQMNSTLSSEDHVNKICAEVNSSIAMLRQSAQFLPQSARMELVKGLILPRYIYCLDLYFLAMSTADSINLLKSFKNCLRYIFKIHYHEPVSHLTPKVIGCTSLTDYLKAHCCIRMFKILKTEYPRYLHELIKFPSRRRNKNLAKFPMWTDHARKDFFYAGAELWNALDSSVRCEQSEDEFRFKCFAFFGRK